MKTYNLTVYTYGRYAELGKDKGSLNSTNLTGQGVLIILKGERAIEFVAKYVNEYGANVYDVKDADAEKVDEYFTTRFESSALMPETGAYKDDPDARVIDEYNLLDNNCTTISIEGVEAGLLDGELDYHDEVSRGRFHATVNAHVISISPNGIDDQLNEATKLQENEIDKL